MTHSPPQPAQRPAQAPHPDAPVAVAAVVGLGYMGGGIAASIARAGVQCRVFDADAGRTAARIQELTAEFARLAEDGLIPGDEARAVAENLVPGSSLEADLPAAQVVIEAVPESIELKHAVLGKIDRSAAPDAVIGTNTSSIRITELAGALRDPGRFAGTHWMNPAPFVPGVEIVPSPHTRPETVERLRRFHAQIGKVPTVVGDVTGFVANRLQHVMFCEAARLVAEGVASAVEVDEVVRHSFGYRLAAFGPFEVADIAGLDVYQASVGLQEGAYGERFAVPEALRELVASGRLGLKSGAGFTPLAGRDPKEVALARDRYFIELTRLLERPGSPGPVLRGE